jgi:hypothetical protein
MRASSLSKAFGLFAVSMPSALADLPDRYRRLMTSASILPPQSNVVEKHGDAPPHCPITKEL